MTTKNQADAVTSPAIRCALCDLPVGGLSYREEERSFCCIGCQTVFRVLSLKTEEINFREHPLFLQAVKSGLISNPALIKEIASTAEPIPEKELSRLHLEIRDLWCPSCAEIIRLLLCHEKGVKNCLVDYSTDMASVEYSPRHISKEKILDLIGKMGYRPEPLQTSQERKLDYSLLMRLSVAAFCSLNIMMLSYPIYASYFTADLEGYSRTFAWISFFACIPILIFSAWPILKRFFYSSLFGYFGMETLVVIGVSSALSLSLFELWNGGRHVYFDSIGVIITFVLLGKLIESRAKFSVKETLFRLSRARPKRGRKRFGDRDERFVPLKEICKGDFLIVFAGEKVVLDGIVVEGQGSCDESLMTGEAIPTTKQKGSSVLGGTILSQGRIVFKVTAAEEETALQHVIETIEKDIGKKARYSRAVDPIVRIFVPAILSIAFGTAVGAWLFGNDRDQAILRAVSVLLISCPCAIGIAAPLAESQILNAMANLGAIIRNRGCLLDLGREDVIVFDKTGTVTNGNFKLVKGVENLTEKERRALKGMASQTAHPIGAAIFRSLRGTSHYPEAFEEIVGKGIHATIEGSRYYLGSKPFLTQMGIDMSGDCHQGGRVGTVVYFANEKKCLTQIVLGDSIKDDAPTVIQSLPPAHTLLLSGDSEASVKAVAEACGFAEWRACFSPLEKREFIDKMRSSGKIVCMMGDGINDAPALTTANIGISVVTATDLSVQVSDIMLTTDRLSVLPKIRTLAVKGQKILRQNLFWAFFYNTIGIGIAAAGFLNPLISAIAMVLSSLFVILNVQRIQISSK